MFNLVSAKPILCLCLMRVCTAAARTMRILIRNTLTSFFAVSDMNIESFLALFAEETNGRREKINIAGTAAHRVQFVVGQQHARAGDGFRRSPAR